jgi:hypothetical protein
MVRCKRVIAALEFRSMFLGVFSGRPRRRIDRVVCIAMKTPNQRDVHTVQTTSYAASVLRYDESETRMLDKLL